MISYQDYLLPHFTVNLFLEYVLLIIYDLQIQFVNFTEIMSKSVPQSRKETEFALSALMEIPSQYKATMELGLLGYAFFSLSAHPSPSPLPFPTSDRCLYGL